MHLTLSLRQTDVTGENVEGMLDRRVHTPASPMGLPEMVRQIIEQFVSAVGHRRVDDVGALHRALVPDPNGRLPLAGNDNRRHGAGGFASCKAGGGAVGHVIASSS